jgi:hypothetical protein
MIKTKDANKFAQPVFNQNQCNLAIPAVVMVTFMRPG